MVIPELEKIDVLLGQLDRALKALDAAHPHSSELIVKSIHDRCIDTDTGRYRLPSFQECTEIAREQIQRDAVSVQREVMGVRLFFL
ncbi:MAG: hypothetical protein KGL39_03050 [Patescibacteria group bacterium]|nr:hypothetical protein [Patescibacteria group bacterium]